MYDKCPRMDVSSTDYVGRVGYGSEAVCPAIPRLGEVRVARHPILERR